MNVSDGPGKKPGKLRGIVAWLATLVAAWVSSPKNADALADEQKAAKLKEIGEIRKGVESFGLEYGRDFVMHQFNVIFNPATTTSKQREEIERAFTSFRYWPNFVVQSRSMMLQTDPDLDTPGVLFNSDIAWTN